MAKSTFINKNGLLLKKEYWLLTNIYLLPESPWYITLKSSEEKCYINWIN